MSYILDYKNWLFILESATSAQALDSQSKQFGIKIPAVLKIRQALGLGPDQTLTPEVIASFEKQKGLPDSGGKLTGGNPTFLSLLKGKPSEEETVSQESPSAAEPVDVAVGEANEEMVTEGLSLPTTQDGWLAACNKVLGTIKSEINGKSSFISGLLTSAAKKEIDSYYEKCYTTDLYFTSFETCFSIGLDFKIKSFSIDTLTLSKHNNGQTIMGTAGATVKGWIFVQWWGEKGTNIHFTVNASIPISMYRFEKIRLHAPTIKISTEWIDCTVCDVKLKDNYLKVYNSVFGTGSWDLEIQESINSGFTTSGLSFETSVAKTIGSAYTKL
jgi:hypothetical protein